MKKLFFIAFCLILSTTFAQKKAIKKTAKLFDKKEYQKCILYAQKELNKYPQTAELHYFISYSQLKSRKYPFDSSFFHLVKAKEFDKNQQLNIQKGNLLYDIHVKKMEEICSKHPLKDYQQFLEIFANIFQDSLICYQEVIIQKPIFNLDLKIDSIISFALTHQNKPYKYGEEGPDAFDCSGFILYVHKNFNIHFPHNAHTISQLDTGKYVTIDEIKKGDLVFFGSNRAYHVGMYISNPNEEPKIIHCVSKGVIIDDFSEKTYWKPSNTYKIKRIHVLEKE